MTGLLGRSGGYFVSMRITRVGIAILTTLALSVAVVAFASGALRVIGVVVGGFLLLFLVSEGVTVGPFIGDSSDVRRKREIAMREAGLRAPPPISGPAPTDEALWARERERRRRLAAERESAS
jgi:hypothetical protein